MKNSFWFAIKTILDTNCLEDSVINILGLLELCRHTINASSTYSRHLAEKFLCQREFISHHVVMGDRQPARASLLNRMGPVASCPLRNPHHQCLRIAMEHVSERLVVKGDLSERSCCYA